MTEWRYIYSLDPRILNLETRWRWVVKLYAPVDVPQGKRPRYPLARMLGGVQIWSGCHKEGRDILKREGERTTIPRSSNLSLYRLMHRGSWVVSDRCNKSNAEDKWSVVPPQLNNECSCLWCSNWWPVYQLNFVTTCCVLVLVLRKILNQWSTLTKLMNRNSFHLANQKKGLWQQITKTVLCLTGTWRFRIYDLCWY